MQQPTPLEPIETHNFYACSWIINQHGINQFRAMADVAAELGIALRVRRMFTDQHGYVMYPFTVNVPDEATLRAFVEQVAAGMGMNEWYIVNAAYYEQGVPFAANLDKVLAQMPRWEEQMRQYAAHNAGVYAALHQQTPGENEDA